MLPIDPWVMELLEDESHEWVTVPMGFPEGASLRSLDLRARTGCSVLVVEHRGASTRNPAADHPLHAGDRLLVIGQAAGLALLERSLAEMAAEAAAAGELDFGGAG
jgi:K+/H+ antiporter YhaU regulatory subunit KhtT